MSHALVRIKATPLDVHSYVASRVLNPDALAEGMAGATRRALLAEVGVDDEHPWTYEDFVHSRYGTHRDRAYLERLRRLRHGVKQLAYVIFYGGTFPHPMIPAGLQHPRVRALWDSYRAAYARLDALTWRPLPSS